LRHRKTGAPQTINFTFANKLQRKFSPLYLKRILPEWRENTARQLPAFVAPVWAKAFRENTANNAADFCLEMYRRMGLLDGIEIVRSSASDVRQAACEISDFFVDLPLEGEVVRARYTAEGFELHEGGSELRKLPLTPFERSQVNPTRDTRLRWMQSVIHCTHYIAGLGEQAYLNKNDAPEIIFVTRDTIENSDEAYTDAPL
jgi:hypothetical protein